MNVLNLWQDPLGYPQWVGSSLQEVLWAPLSPQEEKKNKQMLAPRLFELSDGQRTDSLLPRLCAQQGKRPQTNEIVFFFFFSVVFLLCQQYRCNVREKKKKNFPMLAHFCKLLSHNQEDRDGSQFMIHGCCWSLHKVTKIRCLVRIYKRW